jgi:two-component system nitrogen regulation response regulator GlnG
MAYQRPWSAIWPLFCELAPTCLPGLYHRAARDRAPAAIGTLAATRGNQIRAADLLGVNRNTLRKKIRDLDIQVFRSGG